MPIGFGLAQPLGLGAHGVGMAGCPEARLVVSPDACRPGEVVHALLHVDCTPAAGGAAQLLELHVEVTGVERVDTGWVSPTYRRGVPALNSDRRRVQRAIVRSQLRAACQADVGDASGRRLFVMR